MGVPYFNRQGKLVKCVEKPNNPPNDLAIIGVYFFNNDVFRCFKGRDKIKPSARGEYEIPDVYQWLIDHKYKVDVYEYKGRWLDPGKFGDWIESNQYLLDRNTNGEIKSKIDKESLVEGRVTIGKNCKIKNSKIRGPVVIGDKVVIKDSFIGPYTSISENCFVENSRVENSVLMAGVTIRNVLQTIDNSLIGTGTEISDVKSQHGNCLELFVGEKSQVRL